MVQLYARFGGESLVNTTTPGWQSNAKITRLSSGGFVVAWSDSSGIGGDPDGYGIKAQLYNAAGAKVGGEFLVNSATAGSQILQGVAATPGGGFAAVYETEYEALRAQIFDGSGNKVGSELFVTVQVPNPGVLNSNATVTVLTNGVMIVAWDRFDPYSGPNYGEHVYARAFNSATGASLGSEFRLDTGVEAKYNVSVAALASGGWVATWTTNNDGDHNVTGQVFAANGVKVGGEFAVNTAILGNQGSAVVLALPAGGFVVAFLDNDANPGDGSYFGIRAQIFNDSGVKVGPDFPVNTVTDGDQYSISMDDLPGGGFVISWTDGSRSLGDDQGTSVMAQVFDSAGAKVGSQFVVNTITDRDQSNPAVVGLASGGFAVAWQNRLGDELSQDVDIKLQMFAPTAGAATDIALSPASVSETSIGNFAAATFSDNGGVNSAKTYTLLADSTGGGFRIEGNRLVVADNRKLDHETAPTAILTVRVTDSNGNSFDEAVSVAIADAAIEERYSAGQEFTVSSTAAAGQTIAATAALAGGGFVMTWTDNSTGDANPDNHINVKGQLYDATGAKVGDAFVVNTVVQSWQAAPAAAGLASGGFVVVWEDASHIGGDLEWAGLKGQRFDSSGAKVGSEFLVNTATEGSQYDASVAKLASGGFVVTWTSDATHTPVISAQLFDSSGAKVGGEFAVNPNTGFGQTALHSSVTALADGSFVVVWTSQLQVRAQIIGANGVKIGSDFAVAGDGYGQDYASVAALSTGGFVVSWHDENHLHGDTNGKGVKAQVFDSSGAKVGTSFLVNTRTDGSQTSPTVGGLPWGGFVISWLDSAMFSDNTSALGVRSQIFDGTGAKVGGEIIIDTGAEHDKSLPVSAVLASGGFVVGWAEAYLDGNSNALTRFEGRVISRAATDNSGNDILTGDANANLLDGGAGNDQIYGNGGADDLRGGTGNDWLHVSGTGIAAADGGADFDTLTVNYGDAATAITMGYPNADPNGGLIGSIGDGGARRVDYGSINILHIATGSGNDTVYGGQSGSTASLGGGDDRFYGSFDPGPNETADGGLGVDGVSAGLGLATSPIVWNLQTNSFSSPIGNYTNFEYFLGILTGSAGDTIVTTSANLNDTFSMGSGDDVATVINGQDHASGEFGNDLLIIDYSASTNAIVTTGGAAGITLGSDSSGVSGQIGDGGSRRVNFFNIDRFDVRTGSGNDAVVLGTGGLVTNDIVSLGGGDDEVDFGRGADQGNGGSGVDSLAADLGLAGTAISINLATNSFSGPAGMSFVNFEYFGGSGFRTGQGADSVVTGLLELDDLVLLGAGNDSVTVHNGNDSVYGEAGSDLLVVNYIGWTEDVVTTSGAVTAGTGGSGVKGRIGAVVPGGLGVSFDNMERFEVRTGSGNDSIVLGTGSIVTSDLVNLGGGDDAVDFGRGIDAGDGGSGTDSLAADLSLAGTAVSINLVTNSFSGPAGMSFVNFEYFGGTGFRTGQGADTVVTGQLARNDIVALGSGNDNATVHNGQDEVNGQAGSDLLVVDYRASTAAIETAGGAGGISAATDGSGVKGRIGDGADRRVDFDNIERLDVRTGSGNDHIALGTAALATNDIVDLGGGDDFADLGRGLDQGNGGSGLDGLAADFSLAGGAIGINLQLNSWSGPAGTSFTNFEYLGSPSSNFLTGSGNDTVVTGSAVMGDFVGLGAGNDSITVYNGPDSVNGQAGTDLLVIDYSNATAAIVTTGGAGGITLGGGGSGVRGRIGVEGGGPRSVLFDNVERFDVRTGSGNDNIVLGTGSLVTSDVVSLGGGDDSVDFGRGIDVGDGGAGVDSLAADISLAGVAISINLVTNSFSGPAGMSFVNFEYFGGSGLHTGQGADTVATGLLARNDIVALGSGNDIVTLHDGADTVYGGAIGAGASNSGFDTLVLDYGAATAAVSNLVAIQSNGAGAFGQIGDSQTRSATFQAIDRFLITTGSAGDSIVTAGGNDEIRTAGGNDSIAAGGGDDLLDGGTGADQMAGGAGNDSYVVDDSGDTVSENSGEGTDNVTTALAVYSLAALAHVENLTGTSAAGQTLTGNAANNLVNAGSGNDVLHLWAGGGNDIVNAGAGLDNIFFGATLTGADVVNGGAGVDTLVVQGPYGSLSLTANITQIENISILAGSNTAFGEPGTNRYDYVLTTHDSNFAAGVQARINGAALLEGEDFTFNGSAETDASFVVYGGKGKDTLLGGQGNDIFFYAEERFASGDTVNGGAGYDGMFLRGNYTIDFNAPGYTGLFTNIENLTLTSATDERYARGGGTEFDYNLILSDAIVNAGQELTVSGALLLASETMIVDASQESNGFLRLFGGKAADTLKGGANADLLHGGLGADTLAGGGGADVFRYQAVTESYSVATDQILDFTPGTDRIELNRIDSNSTLGGDQAFTWIGSNAFSNQAGQLRAFQSGDQWMVQGDINGDGHADLIIALTLQGPNPLGAGDFIL